MGYIDFCSSCKYSYTSDCKYGSKECNQERARIMLETTEEVNKEENNRYDYCHGGVGG